MRFYPSGGVFSAIIRKVYWLSFQIEHMIEYNELIYNDIRHCCGRNKGISEAVVNRVRRGTIASHLDSSHDVTGSNLAFSNLMRDL